YHHRRDRRQAVHLMTGLKHPVTPDGRYFVVRGRLWRLANPDLSSEDVAKRKLGERGPAWWTDGSPDLNRHMVKNTPYASWYSGLRTAGRRTRFAETPEGR